MEVLRRVLVIVLLTACSVPGPAAAQWGISFENPMVGEKAPEFKLPTLSGKPKNLSDLREGKNAILFFWATWCPHCRTQLKVLSQKKTEIEEAGIKVILVDTEEPAERVQSYIDTNKIKYDVFLDENSEVSGQYSIIGVPTFVFVDSEGVIKSIEHHLPDNYREMF